MGKILRLSLFNLRKNKKEAAAIVFLTLVSTMMLGIFAINLSKVSNAFDESFAKSGSVDTFISFSENDYRDSYREILEEDYGMEVIRPENRGRCVEEVVLGEDEYFVMGDNRNDSLDSRFPAVGNLKKEDFVGKAVFRLFPLSHMGGIYS